MLFYLEKNFRIYLRNRFIKAIFVAHLSMCEPILDNFCLRHCDTNDCLPDFYKKYL